MGVARAGSWGVAKTRQRCAGTPPARSGRDSLDDDVGQAGEPCAAAALPSCGCASSCPPHPPCPLPPCSLHYFEFDGPAVCTNATCQAPGPGSRFLRELEQLAAFREAHAARLPPTVW